MELAESQSWVEVPMDGDYGVSSSFPFSPGVDGSVVRKFANKAKKANGSHKTTLKLRSGLKRAFNNA